MGVAARAQSPVAIAVSTPADLVAAIGTVNSNPSTNYNLNLVQSIALGEGNTLPIIDSSAMIVIDGHGNTLSGGGLQRGFVVFSGTVTLQNMTLSNLVASGGRGGGGGLGAGGALFVNTGSNVRLSNVRFASNSAAGGPGGGPRGGEGGGGMGGAGGTGSETGAGGGGLGIGADGGPAAGGNGHP
ncbi:MAG TPA: hypothetical protein VHC86_08970, partial [Opitutaceae bacterium]|nr:hypothetical protein [Opitutaceae bacterium]